MRVYVVPTLSGDFDREQGVPREYYLSKTLFYIKIDNIVNC